MILSIEIFCFKTVIIGGPIVTVEIASCCQKTQWKGWILADKCSAQKPLVNDWKTSADSAYTRFILLCISSLFFFLKPIKSNYGSHLSVSVKLEISSVPLDE